jgi:hypothetical protein
MRWFQSKRHKKNHRDTDWDFFDGYPPNLRMRKLTDGVWNVRPATEEEMREFMASEAEFVSKRSISYDAAMNPDDRLPADAERDVPAPDAEDQTSREKP